MTAAELIDALVENIRAGRHEDVMALWERHGPGLMATMTPAEHREIAWIFEIIDPDVIAASLGRLTPAHT